MSFSASTIFFKGRKVPVVDQSSTNPLPEILKDQERTYLGNNQANPFSPRSPISIKKKEEKTNRFSSRSSSLSLYNWRKSL